MNRFCNWQNAKLIGGPLNGKHREVCPWHKTYSEIVGDKRHRYRRVSEETFEYVGWFEISDYSRFAASFGRV